jgi:hypothetical protein
VLGREHETDGRIRLESAMRARLPAPEARAKAVQALVRVWITPPDLAAPMIRWARDRAERVGDARILHIGSLLAVYPFLADAWAAVGRQVLLQGEVPVASVRKRLEARWGQREAVRVAGRAAIRTLRSLGVLKGRPRERRLLPGDRLVVSADLVPWIIHALCLARGTSELGLQEARSTPTLFMLNLTERPSTDYPFLERLIEGGDRKVFSIRQTGQIPLLPGRKQ